jgi:hypothetical protein
MTTNRRKLDRKRRAQSEIDAWETYMLLGADFFHDLDRAGLSKEDEREAPAVWARYADRFVAEWKSWPNRPHALPYGARRFGYQSNTH